VLRLDAKDNFVSSPWLVIVNGCETIMCSQMFTRLHRGKVLWGTVAGLQPAEYGRGEEEGIECGAADSIGAIGSLIALAYVLTLEDPQPFTKSRDAGCYVGLQPGRRNSGSSTPPLHISKEGDPYTTTNTFIELP